MAGAAKDKDYEYELGWRGAEVNGVWGGRDDGCGRGATRAVGS